MIEASSLYHNSTSYDRYKMTPHFLDWQNQPMVFKDYPGIKPVSLPRNDKLPEESFISLLRERGMDDKAENINLEYLSLILLLTSTLTSKASHSGGEFHFR
ncbi:MAG: hypothetical protein SV375_14305, partial [Thermodesulfobacteriota bacterium]|nr:hypothetical protein [Thermodesulfobacteriota bacterium]